MSESSDPFACFDSDDDEAPAVTASSQNQKNKDAHVIRDPSCGVLAFHRGTEQALWNYVSSEMEKSATSIPTTDLPGAVLKAIDTFCYQRHWMMNIGEEKGQIVTDFIQKCCVTYKEQNYKTPLVFVELGTYCGYSSIMFSKAIKDSGVPFHLFSVEVVKENAQVAEKLISLAGLDKDIIVLLLDTKQESLESLLRATFYEKLSSQDTSTQQSQMKVDLLFIDHDKDLYLKDLRDLEQCSLVRKGCYVAADNVVFAKIDAYRDHMKELAGLGIIQTELKESRLEYCDPDLSDKNIQPEQLIDGVGKYGSART